MSSGTDEIVYQFRSFFRAYKDGRVERFFGTDRIPATIGSPDGVSSKDVVIVPETGVSARIYIPAGKLSNSGRKLPLLVYLHGGGFLLGSPYCAIYHNYVTSLVSEAKVVAVSVDYRLAPEHPVPAAYEDSWAALKWVASHYIGQGPEAWLNHHVDFDRVFLGGDSAGANISHSMAAQAGVEGLYGMKLSGICVVHPYFGRMDGEVEKSWLYACPTTTGFYDVRINPAVDSRLSRLGCSRVLVCVAGKDALKERGVCYYEAVRKSGWNGELEIVETEGEDHVFHLFNPDSDNASALLKILASFLNQP